MLFSSLNKSNYQCLIERLDIAVKWKQDIKQQWRPVTASAVLCVGRDKWTPKHFRVCQGHNGISQSFTSTSYLLNKWGMLNNISLKWNRIEIQILFFIKPLTYHMTTLTRAHDSNDLSGRHWCLCITKCVKWMRSRWGVRCHLRVGPAGRPDTATGTAPFSNSASGPPWLQEVHRLYCTSAFSWLCALG